MERQQRSVTGIRDGVGGARLLALNANGLVGGTERRRWEEGVKRRAGPSGAAYLREGSHVFHSTPPGTETRGRIVVVGEQRRVGRC